MSCQKSDRILILGAGCFGLSTAYHLLRRGFTDVTVMDRSPVLPAPDAASNDINRVVRTAYADPFYANLAKEAIHAWKNESWLQGAYHESGVLILSLKGADSGSYTDSSYKNDVLLGARIQNVSGYDEIRKIFPEGINVSQSHNGSGYLNRDGGWANAGKGVELMAKKVQSMGGKFLLGKTASKMSMKEGRAEGVLCEDGRFIDSDFIVIALGSWTASALPELNLSQYCVATGQCVAMIKLTPEEAELYRKCPVYLDFEQDGSYCFPPNEDNIMKFAIHGPGYTRDVQGISTPRTIHDDKDHGLLIPKDALKELRKSLMNLYPDLATKQIIGTRLCWYNETDDEDWLIGFLPQVNNVMLATGGSGHAYKFLPVIGTLTADAIEGKMESSIIHKFSPSREKVSQVTSRSQAIQKRQELATADMCNLEDL